MNEISELRAENYALKLNLPDVVNCVYVVTERDNYGEQLFRGVFANREKAVDYLSGNGLTESNIDEINEIECKYKHIDSICDNCPFNNFELTSHPSGDSNYSVEKHYCDLGHWEDEF